MLGIDCAVDLTSGTHNTLIGSQAGIGITTGSYNTIVSSGDGLVTTGGTNTIIGHNAGFYDTTQHNFSTALGYNAKITKDSQIVLGNSSTEVYIPNNVGIGTSSPGSKFVSSHSKSNRVPYDAILNGNPKKVSTER